MPTHTGQGLFHLQIHSKLLHLQMKEGQFNRREGGEKEAKPQKSSCEVDGAGLKDHQGLELCLLSLLLSMCLSFSLAGCHSEAGVMTSPGTLRFASS